MIRGCVRIIDHSSVFLSPASDSIQTNAFLQHSHFQTLLKTTSLASFSTAFVNFAIIGRRTSVVNVSCKLKIRDQIWFFWLNWFFHLGWFFWKRLYRLHKMKLHNENQRPRLHKLNNNVLDLLRPQNPEKKIK